jgi:DivIVA domain-containing protein
VHDVVFRVRFGGYDEWQVDLHLDRVERQLAEFEDRGGRPPAPDPLRDSMRGGLNAGGMSGAGMGRQDIGNTMGGGMGAASGRMAPPTERLQAPIRDDRMAPQMRDDRMAQQQQQQQIPQRPQMPPPDPYGRYEDQGYGQPPPPMQPPPQQPQLPQRPNVPQGYDPSGYDQTGGYDGFEAGRHGKTDMTAEIRMPQREQDPRGYGSPPMSAPPMSAPPMGGAYGQPPQPQQPQQQQPQLPPPMGEPGGELYRVDQLRRTFQPRRFGSGYDPAQVDRLFEGILQAMTGRGPMPVPENELDMLQFGLVSGGYFEAEVDAALREVKDILLRRR